MVLSCEFCENFKNTYFEKHRQTPASTNFFDNLDESTTYQDDEDRELLDESDDEFSYSEDDSETDCD